MDEDTASKAAAANAVGGSIPPPSVAFVLALTLVNRTKQTSEKFGREAARVAALVCKTGVLVTLRVRVPLRLLKIRGRGCVSI